MSKYNLTREKAAEFLSTSTRTLDRKVASGLIYPKKISGRILFSEEELEKLKKNPKKENVKIADKKESTFSFKKERKENKTIPIFKSQEQSSSSNINEKALMEKAFYKKMYESLFEELKIKQLKIEELNYQLGENKHKMDIPLLESKMKDSEISILKTTISKKENEISNLEKKVSFQKFIKIIFIILLIIAISVIGFWYFYNFK